MNVAPAASFEAVIDAGQTGLTPGVEANDNQGAAAVAYTAATTEIAVGVYVANLTAPATRGQYTLIWRDAPAGTVLGIEDLLVTSSAGEPFTGDVYGTVDELFRILKIRTPSAEETEAAERVLTAATGEINSEIDLPDGEVVSGWQISLATEVAYERAVEHWQQGKAPLGLVGLGADSGFGFAARFPWQPHADKLAPLKAQWGLA